MIICFDVHYETRIATTAAVCFQNWTDHNPLEEFIHINKNIKPYESGSFFKRELPCLISTINKHSLQPQIIIIDGYVWLDENQIGLGGHLYQELNEKIPIIGVAKTEFKHHNKVKKVLRGNSQTPLFITAIDYDLNKAIGNVEKMDGSFRIPTLLKRTDQLCRGIVTANKW